MNQPNHNDNDGDVAAVPANAAAAAAANEDDDDAAAIPANAHAANNDEEEEDAVDDDDFNDDPAEMVRICNEAIAILQNRLHFPFPQSDRSIVRFAQQFIRNVKEDIHKTITDTRLVEEGYDGLDSERDTEEEVATAIRCCPEVLTRRDERFVVYPIMCLTFVQSEDNTKRVSNEKAVSFIHLFVRLAIEFNSFQDEERGGLLIENANERNTLQCLTCSSHSSYDENHHQLVDTTFLTVLIRLRRSGYFLKEDIQQFKLVHFLCHQNYFSEECFRFLVEWDPAALLQTGGRYNTLPFQWATCDIRAFRVVLDAYFRYYPKVGGFKALFHMGDYRKMDFVGFTPYSLACKELTRTKVLEVVEEILVRYTTKGLCNTDNGNALILAATDDTISLDGLYFLMRRQPDTMIRMLVRNPRHDKEGFTTILSSSSSKNNTNNNGRTNEMDDLAASLQGVTIQQATVICSYQAKVYRGGKLVTIGWEWEWIKLEKYDANGKFALAVRTTNGTVLNMPISHGMPGGLQRQRQSNKSGIFLTHMLQDGEHEVVTIITNNDDHEKLHEILRQIIIIGNTNP